jgi:hypothetical protein
MDGNGTNTWPDGSSYVGEWKGNQKDGLGTMTSAGGTVTHSGRWKKWKICGIISSEFGTATLSIMTFS